MSDPLRGGDPPYPLAVICAALDLPRRSISAHERLGWMAAADAQEQQVRTHSERIAGEWPPYGSRRVSAQLRRDGAGAVKGKRVRPLMGELGRTGARRPYASATLSHDQP